MVTNAKIWQILPQDVMVMQLSHIDLLLAMYPEDAAIDESTKTTIDDLRDWCDGGSSPLNVTPSVCVLLKLDISDELGEQYEKGARPLQLDISVPLQYATSLPPSEPPQIRVRIQQPAWMSKAEVSSLNSDLPAEDLLTIIEHIKDECSKHESTHQQTTKGQSKAENEPLVRVWFYFPSISTRSKRDDLINHAPSYGLTGFLLAGKPGILCLEGGSKSIDDYMKFIKTESWGDIPAHHKKVSERYRETGEGVKRVFFDMQEITDVVGERRGERANRGDMKAVEAWLSERGLGEALEKVLM